MATAARAAEQEAIYYPEDRLPAVQTFILGIQHVMAMFGATVVVPLILGFNVNTVLLFSGVATLLFLAVTGGKVPSYLGSSFSFIGSVLAIQGGAGHNQSLAFAGIFIAGALYFLAGFAVHLAGSRVIRFFMPPVVTGAVVAVIGLALAPVAWSSYSKDLLTATVTVLAAALASVYLRGFLRLLPIVIGVVVGYVVSLIDPACAAATAGCHVNWTLVTGSPWIGHPQFSFPPQFTWHAVSLFWFVPILLIAENTGHVYAISGLMKRDLSGMLGRTFMGDGLGTMLSALFGGTGETTYAENIGVMGITRVFSISVYVTAAVVAILLGFIPKFGGLVGSIPISVLGGTELYLFGLIATIGGKIWVDAGVDFSNRTNLATAAIALTLAASGADVKMGAFEINNLGLGALGAIIVYQILRPGAGATAQTETSA